METIDIGGKSLEKRDILYTSAKLKESQLLRNLNASNDPNHVFDDDDLK